MIDYSKVQPGDRLRIVGAGAPGFARHGDIVTVTACNGTNRCDVVNEAGEQAYFALTCGAARLEPESPPPEDAAAVALHAASDDDRQWSDLPELTKNRYRKRATA